MAKSPTGSRPTPKVAQNHKPSYDTSSGSYAGKRNSKSPTGNRPRPAVAKNTPSVPGPPAKPKYPKKTAMPAPKMKWGKRGGGKPMGGK